MGRVRRAALVVGLASWGAAPVAVAAQSTPRAAGAVQVTARISPDSVGIGEPITVALRVRAPIGSEVRFPALPDSSEVVEPLDPRQLRDASTASILDRTATYRLIAWDTGRRVVRFGDITVVRDGAETRYPVALPALRVRTVLPADTAKRRPRDGAALLEIPGGWWRFWVGGVVVLGLLYLLWRAWRDRRAARALRGPDAAAVASDGFAHAARLGLLDAGETGRFALTHVDVMRRYLAMRFPQAGPSRTAREVAEALVGAEFPILPGRVADLLLRCEPIAFAHAPVSAEEARGIAEEARAIVREVETALRARQGERTKVRRRPL